MGYRIVVTGGAGYIGSVLVPELLSAGHEVTVVDNFLYRQNSLSHACYYPGFSIVNGDVRNDSLMEPLLKKADIIIPLAALVGAPLCQRDPLAATSTNREAPVRMFKNLSRDQWVLMPTTNSAYGTGDGNNYCNEESPLNPISLYAKDKVEVEKALLERENAVSFRLATVFGMSPRMRIDLLVNDFTYRAVYDRFVILFEAHFKRNYIHVRDVVRAFQFGIANFPKVKGQAFNVGLSDANLSKLELCVAIQKQLPDFVYMEAPVGRDPDRRNYIVSNEKIEKAGYRPQFALDVGITELIKGFTMIKNSQYGNV
ncbi:MAG: NAD-dependent epimerase/dehydratase [Deltaproteobacteria bacterium]|nr:NAD-dependent epimerase/dehydratase [Deltaproteobacteria bacterium]